MSCFRPKIAWRAKERAVFDWRAGAPSRNYPGALARLSPNAKARRTFCNFLMARRRAQKMFRTKTTPGLISPLQKTWRAGAPAHSN
jgi:hypothetical protein